MCTVMVINTAKNLNVCEQADFEMRSVQIDIYFFLFFFKI